MAKVFPFFAILFQISILVPSNVLGEGSQAFDPASFNRWSQNDRLALLLAGLREHERAFQNVHYQVEWTPNRPNTASVDFKRIGEMYRYDYCRGGAAPGPWEARTIASWDGKQQTWWHSFQENPLSSGLIQLGELDALAAQPAWWYSEQLGLRSWFPINCSVSDLIEGMHGNPNGSSTVQTVTEGGEPYIDFAFSLPYWRYEYVVDSGHQFCIKHHYTFDGAEGRRTKDQDVTTDSMKMIAGTWVPSHVTHEDFAGGETFKTEMTLTACEFGALIDKDLIVEFPPKTRVFDQIQKVAFVVQANGKKRYLQIFNDQKIVSFNQDKPFKIIGKTVDGADFTTASWKGKVILVNFWATWCGPCIGEVPRVKKMYAQYHAQGLEVLGVSNDFSANSLKTYLAKNNMPWPELFDPAAAEKQKFNSLTTNLAIDGIPIIFLIDRMGICRSVRGDDQMEDLIPKLLAESAN
jgi:thiol-disulfide isomerase/thioredoxin